MCKADRFVADEPEEAVKGEKRRRGGEGRRVDLEGVLDATADEVASLEDLLDRQQLTMRKGSTACIFAYPH
jgi:hypothetical protein